MTTQTTVNNVTTSVVNTTSTTALNDVTKATTPTNEGVTVVTKGSTKYSYVVPTLKGEKGWTLKGGDKYRASTLAVVIMGYRRQYRSEGIANFVRNWLLPTLSDIIIDLQKRGYTVAYQLVGAGGDGYINVCIDVSKGDQLGDTLYVAHYDTVDRDITVPTNAVRKWDNVTRSYVYEQPKQVEQTPQEQRLYKKVSIKDGIASLKENHTANVGAGCLGADDGAGLAVMLHLLQSGVVGGYCFTTGEEVGGVGAGEVLAEAKPFLKQYKRSIEIDRRGCEDVIYSQSVGDCASKTFTQWLCDTLGMGHKPSDLGTYTDVATFAEVIPENVNIASGYISAHSPSEQVDLVYLDKLAEALKAVDWSTAPTEREAGDFGYTGYGYGGYSSGYYDDYYPSYKGNSKKSTKSFKPLSEKTENLIMTLIQLDRGFRGYVFKENITTEEDFEFVFEQWYGQPVDEALEVLAELF